ncbi:SMC5-SMC6 complex localization factor protein 2 isoform X1 [Poecilia formosa]|uniref:SMC5-SMC6 complex localization factor protein 2 isoform X1 n=1 Tax=Poecilia formosa TaxID=48698 RepID=UPI0007B8D069|nr:PREDICTED: SMC5-SMC6 complex localization factor protein 2-like isoform X1 [Poecilia formosa]XP_016534209.1 PREDICTED: SMC5-SMC6 complex localization factor protein 2-like isoform X1 [Poecilia formosa]XP_016534210.1 PREDICTED: SMC5-SMC6 complex localization factor protein 2-like isoform X1 [Poecilia formosa]
MDPALQQHSLSHFASFPQETPIRPSQVPNLLSHPAPRRVLPLQTPEECNMNKLSPKWHPAGMIYPAALISSSSTNIVSPVNSLLKDRLGPLKPFPPPHGHVLSSPVNVTTSARENLGPQHTMIRLDSGYFTSPQVVSASQTKTHISAERTFIPTIFNSPSPQSGKNISNPLPSCLSRRDQGTESKIPFSNSGKNKDVSQREDLRKALLSKLRDFLHNVHLYKSCSHQHEQTCSRESIIPVMDLNSTSQKRRREGEPCFKNTKKPCHKGINHGTAETNGLTPGTSPRSSLDHQPSPKSSSVFESSHETTNRLLKSEPACSALSSTPKPSRLDLVCPKKTPSTGAKKGFITTENNIVKLRLTSTLSEGSPKNQNEENQKKNKSSSSKVHHKECSKPPHVGSVCSNSNSGCSVPVKTESKKIEGISSKPASKPSLSSLSCSTQERSKASRVRKPTVVFDDIDQLFTPDPNVYVVRPACKAPKCRIEEQTIKSPTSKKGCSCSPTVTPISPPATQPLHAASSPASNMTVFLPTVTLERLKLEESQLCPKDGGIRHGPVNSSRSQSKDESFKPQHNLSLKPKTSEGLRCSETDTAASVQETSPPCTKPPPVEEEDSDGSKGGKEEDSIDVELDLGLSISYDIDPSQSSDSSEEEPLISFQEMMERVAKPPDTPQKEAISEPSTPGCRSSQSKTRLPSSSTKPGVYKNNLDQMLKEINSTKKAKEIEAQLLSACNEDLLRLAEYEAAEENQEEIANEHQEFLQHFSLMSAAIREIPPGEIVFNLERFGQIFHQDSLQLRQCHVSPQGASQKTLIWSSPAQLRLHLIVGLFEEAYCNSPCPAQVTRFLFKMMSVHSERIISNKILQALCDIACSAAYQIVNNDNQKFEVWVPSLADVTLVFMNMGAAFVTLFPFESLQPSFTEGDLLEDVYIKSESPSNNNEEISFPEHNCTNILKYLSYCMGLCPRAYSNDELLLLLTVVGRISLDTRRILQSNVAVSCLLYTIINNIRDWSSVLPRVCKALTDLTDDHHNMCLLVQLLPDSKRGIELQRHLSMCFISKLLDGHCTYVPVETELSLAELRPYLPQMQPSALLRSIQQKDKEEAMATQDQQAYYLCYSLLTLTNEASNLQVFKPEQKAQLLVLSSELETHVKCDIRESEKCLYRSKVKDLVARIYTKWQMLLQKTRPLNGKLYDYWQPAETFGNTEEDDEEAIFIEDDEETLIVNENDTLIAEDKEEENEKTEVKEDMEVVEHPGDEENDTKARETTATEEQVTGGLNQAMPVMQPPAVDEQIDPNPKECTATETQTAEREKTPLPDAVM